MQAFCWQSEEELTSKSWVGFFLSLVVIGMTVLFQWWIKSMKEQTSERYEEWDQATTTSSDFTVECKIPEKAYRDFCKWDDDQQLNRKKAEERKRLAAEMKPPFETQSNISGQFSERESDARKQYYDNVDNSQVMRFKLYFISEMERILKTRPHVHDAKAKIRIVDAVIAFKNANLVRMLMDRGQAIIGNNTEKELNINRQITQYIKDNKEDICTPVCAYISFENEECYLRAQSMGKMVKMGRVHTEEKWHGEPLYFKPAPEPSNILWENQWFPAPEKLKKNLITLFTIAFILIVQMSFMFYMNKMSASYQAKYPIVDCNDVRDLYGEKLERFAVLQWSDSEKYDEVTKTSNAAYMCQCEKMQREKGFFSAASTELTTTLDGKEIKGTICADLLKDKVVIQALKVSISLAIVIFNFILRNTIISLVRWVGKKTWSKQMNTILRYIFISQFFNTSILLLMVHANLTNSSIPGLRSVFNGSHPDFTLDWYFKVGGIFVQTMVILGASPLIEATSANV